MKRRTFLGATLAALSVALSSLSFSLRAAADQLASALKPRRVMLPPIPRWNPKTDDMDCADFVQRCQDFERTFLPRDVVFPRAGEIWEAVRDCKVPCRRPLPRGPNPLLMWHDTQLHQGERVRILPCDDPKPLTVTFQRLGDEGLQQTICDDGFPEELWLKTARTFPVSASAEPTAYFTEFFRLVQEPA